MDFILSHATFLCYSSLCILFIIERFSVKFSIPTRFFDGGYFRWSKNLAIGLLNRAILPIIALPITLFAVNNALFHPLKSFNPYIALLLAILFLDLIVYCFHWLNHNLPILWRFHQIHHLDQSVDATTGLRIHTGELFLGTLFRFLPILIMGIPLSAIIIYEVLVTIEDYFHHSNLIIPPKIYRLLNLLFITPDMHAAHHHAFQPDTDSNYGAIFSFWDRIFNTYNRKERSKDWIMGLEYSTDLSLTDLIITPFKILDLKKRNSGTVSAVKQPLDLV
jgi:sterol desaturase/sphingolipid hydroxylase (fatty acid hydroxylase superfamily)